MVQLSPPPGTERILVVRNRFIGDTVLAIPFLRNLRRRFPEAIIDVLVEPAARDVLADCPYIDEIITWKRPHRGFFKLPWMVKSTLALAARLRGRGYTRAYVLKRSLAGSLLVWSAGIPARIGFASKQWAALLTRSVALRRERHEAELFLDLLRSDDIEVDDGRNENWTSPAAVAKVEKLLSGVARGRKRVFVAPRSTDPHREWPIDRIACILRWLVEQHGCEIFFCGAPDDTVRHAEIRGRLGAAADAHVRDHSLDLSLREAVTLISRMDLCLGVDTGLPHIAASFGVPTAVLYGPTDPNKWHPWKTRSAIVQSPSGLIDDISVGQVAEAVGGLLEAIPAAKPAVAAASRTIRTLDLRKGGFRYEVLESKPSAAAEPATNPLAQAH
ncbi:MAG: glycosyltransferase family 9 protein [Planctomycetia bacterium]|jgi:heptosyltransferase-2